MPEPSRTYSSALTEDVHAEAVKQLIRPDRQEDLCFGVWHLSSGLTRATSIVHRLIFPHEGERQVHGNASFNGNYFERALGIARAAGGGLAFIHSHPSIGWQAMSSADLSAEGGHAAASLAVTGLPLLGLTLGVDGSWSARLWPRAAARRYEPVFCNTVRVVGLGLTVTYHPRQVERYRLKKEFQRTMEFWGRSAQEHLGRLHVGICGLGSVGSVVCEALARMGIRELTLIDFDQVRRHNLDRTLGATRRDAREGTPKVRVASRNA